MIADWKGDLATEKSLWAVYKASKKLPKSNFNKFLYAISGLVIAGICLAWTARGQVGQSYDAVMQVTEMAFDLSAQILGFLIGGFAIFATVTDDRLMIRLAQTPMENGLSVFKYVFFNFLSVFYIFIATLSWSVAIRVLSSVQLFDPAELGSRDTMAPWLAGINSIAFAVMMGSMVFAIVRLKSFIWNIYQAFITFLGVSDVMRQGSANPPGQ